MGLIVGLGLICVAFGIVIGYCIGEYLRIRRRGSGNGVEQRRLNDLFDEYERERRDGNGRK